MRRKSRRKRRGRRRERRRRSLAHPYFSRRHRLLPLCLPAFLTGGSHDWCRSYAVEDSNQLDTCGIGVNGSEQEVG
jgi:hypothetical protein